MADAATVARLEGKALEMRRRLLRLANRTNLHIGGDLSMTELMTVIFEYLMQVDPERPTWDARDCFILSKGHGAGALYISMANRGFFDVEEIYATYGALGSRFGMHPCRNHLPGVETSTGSLGHGLSVAVGLALAARLDARTNRVVTLIGDGELNEGSIWEAVMAAAHFRLGNIVAFIDKNDMTMDGATDDIMRVNPVGAKFDAFGWNVVEVDGHEIPALVDAVDALPPPGRDRPTVVVARTVKGRGIGFMENTTKWHSGQIDDATLEQCYAELDARYRRGDRSAGVSVVEVTIDGSAGAANAREVYGAALVELARRHPEVVALTADLMLSHQLKGFKDAHPERFINVGIAEANLMGVAAGLALDGKIPWATTFAAFASMRAHEQVRSDIAYPGLPVKIVGTMGGLSGGVAGPTHAGMEDLGTMRMMPGMTVIAPSDPLHLTQFVEQAYARRGPVYIRLGRGNDPIIYSQEQVVEIGKAITVRDGSDATIVATGVMLREALLAASRLAEAAISARVIDMHTIRPLDVGVVEQAARETGVIVTVEDHMVTNGLGSAVAECIAESGAACRLARLGIPDVFSIIGPPAELYRHHGYDATGIERKVHELLGV